MGNIFAKNIFAAVSDKATLDPLLELLKAGHKARPLAKGTAKRRSGLRKAENIRFWGTNGTVKYLKSKGFAAESVTGGFDFDGRLKSIDKKVFAAILADPADKTHMQELKQLGVEPLNAVVVDLYTLDKNNFPKSMDIGGQTLIRAAVKNFKGVALAFDAGSLKSLVTELVRNDGSTTLAFRKAQVKKALKFISRRTKEEASLL